MINIDHFSGTYDQILSIYEVIDKKIPIEEIRVGIKLKVVPVKISQDRFSYQFENV